MRAFLLLKIILTFFWNPATNHTLPYRYGAERWINTFHVITERGCDYETVGLPKDSTMSIRLQAKTCSQEHCTKYRKELRRRRNKEISFCELPEIVVEKLAVWDEYESDYAETLYWCISFLAWAMQKSATRWKLTVQRLRRACWAASFIFRGWISVLKAPGDSLFPGRSTDPSRWNWPAL